MVKLFRTFIVVASILASPKHRVFTWSYRSSIYRVHWFNVTSDIFRRVVDVLASVHTTHQKRGVIFRMPNISLSFNHKWTILSQSFTLISAGRTISWFRRLRLFLLSHHALWSCSYLYFFLAFCVRLCLPPWR